MASFTPPAPKLVWVEEKGKRKLVVDIEDENSEEHIPTDQPRLGEPEIIVAEDSDEEGALLK